MRPIFFSLPENNSYEDLKNSGAGAILTCNTVVHETNTIGLNDLYVEQIQIRFNKC